MPELGGNTMSLPKFEGKNKPVPMDSLWTPYGVPMDFLWNNTVATPSPHRSPPLERRSMPAPSSVASRRAQDSLNGQQRQRLLLLHPASCLFCCSTPFTMP